jgi:hypothetical protein
LYLFIRLNTRLALPITELSCYNRVNEINEVYSAFKLYNCLGSGC